MFSRTLTGISFACALAIPAAGAAVAQNAPPPPSMAGEASAHSEESLRAFVTATNSVNELVTELQQEYNAAETEEEAAAIQQSAQDQITMRIVQSGLSVEEYNSIQADAQQDPALADRIRTLAAEMQGSQAQPY